MPFKSLLVLLIITSIGIAPGFAQNRYLTEGPDWVSNLLSPDDKRNISEGRPEEALNKLISAYPVANNSDKVSIMKRIRGFAGLYQRRKNYELAESMSQQALKMTEALFQKNGREVCLSRECLLESLICQEKWSDAEALLAMQTADVILNYRTYSDERRHLYEESEAIFSGMGKKNEAAKAHTQLEVLLNIQAQRKTKGHRYLD